MSVLHIVLNPFTNDSRVLREVGTLHELSLAQTVFATHKGELPLTEQHDAYHLRRFRLWSQKLPAHFIVTGIRLIECAIRMTVSGIKLRPRIIHAHDLNGLAIGWLIARFHKVTLIYDAHEYWADCAHKAKFPAWLYDALVPRIERFLANDTDAVITVSQSIVDLLYTELKLKNKPILVRNLPLPLTTVPKKYLRQRLNLSADKKVLVYIGMITTARGVFSLLDAFVELNDPNAVLVYIGNGSDAHALELRIHHLEMETRVYRLPAVDPDELFSYITDADIGLSPIQATNLSYAMCLPNKLFEYMQAGLAVIASDLIEMKHVIDTHQVGVCFKNNDQADLTHAMRMMLQNPTSLATYQQNARRTATESHWETEKQVLIDLYQSFIR
jgi:glycosyltransferase involved in cell wall biosynthesis